MQNDKPVSLLGDAIDKKIIKLCELQGKLVAIKFCKDHTDWELQTAKNYVEKLEAANAVMRGKPVIIDRSGLRGCMFIPGLIFSAIWISLCSVIPYTLTQEGGSSPNDTWFKPMMYLVFGIISLPGLILLIWSARKEYDEKIGISAREVSYFKKGWLRKTERWDEPLINYKGVAAIEEDGVDDSVIYVVTLKHQFDKKKDIVIKESAGDKDQQLEFVEEYAKLLKLSVINESVESEEKSIFKKYPIWSILLMVAILSVFLFFYFKSHNQKKPPENYTNEPYAP